MHSLTGLEYTLKGCDKLACALKAPRGIALQGAPYYEIEGLRYVGTDGVNLWCGLLETLEGDIQRRGGAKRLDTAQERENDHTQCIDVHASIARQSQDAFGCDIFGVAQKSALRAGEMRKRARALTIAMHLQQGVQPKAGNAHLQPVVDHHVCQAQHAVYYPLAMRVVQSCGQLLEQVQCLLRRQACLLLQRLPQRSLFDKGSDQVERILLLAKSINGHNMRVHQTRQRRTFSSETRAQLLPLPWGQTLRVIEGRDHGFSTAHRLHGQISRTELALPQQALNAIIAQHLTDKLLHIWHVHPLPRAFFVSYRKRVYLGVLKRVNLWCM